MARFFVIILIALGCLALLMGPDPETGPGERPRITATTGIIGDWLRHLAGDDFDIQVLMGPDEDPHHFEPAPKEAARLEKADRVFAVGLGYEPWLDGLVSGARQVLLGTDLSLIETGHEDHDHAGHDHDHHHHHEHGEFDPHVWLDPVQARQMLVRIRDQLAELRPDQAEAIRARWEAYDDQLKKLDAWCETTLEPIPHEKRKLITSHRSLAYFARRYGFTIDEEALSVLASGHSDPSIREVTKLIEHITDSGIPTLFGERHHDNRLIRRVAEETKSILETDLATDALTPVPHEASNYIGLMRHNTNLIARGLAP